ncbi:MAG TPA: hypothetical protein VHX14_24090 [Thermoanaerobaculia bacterium]|jgi:hypothetical protein|nr:hypothetical protein [Thermoanaerobaculia bacterium]
MLTAGLALFLFTATANIPQSIALAHPPSVITHAGGVASPDHAPPHPLTPRTHAVELAPKTFLGALMQAAKTALTHAR